MCNLASHLHPMSITSQFSYTNISFSKTFYSSYAFLIKYVFNDVTHDKIFGNNKFLNLCNIVSFMFYFFYFWLSKRSYY